MIETWRNRSTVLAATLLLAGCNPPQPDASTGGPTATPEEVATRIPEADAELLELARAAMRAGNLTGPGQGSAVEYYLALTRRPAQRDLARATLVELRPYVVLATEQALSRQNPEEAKRLALQLEAIDPEAPALPRIRRAVQALELAQARAVLPVPAETPPPVAATTAEPTTALPMAGDEPASSSGEPEDTLSMAAAPPARTPAAPAGTGSPAALPATRVATPAEPEPRRLLKDVLPTYPTLARGRGLEGEVLLGFTIDPEGRVVDAHVLSADPPGTFDRATLAAAAGWRFEPGPESTPGSRRLRFQLSM